MTVDSFGYGTYLPLALLYFHWVTGLPLTRVGLLLSAAALIAVIANPAVGMIVDRYGARTALTASYLARCAAFAAFAVVNNQIELFLAVTVMAGGGVAFQSAIQAFVAEIARGMNRDRLIAVQRSVRNGGLGGGALIASVIVSLHSVAAYRAIVLIACGAFLVAALLVAGIPAPRPIPRERSARQRGGYRAVIRNRPFLTLTLITFPIAFGYMVPSVILSVYISRVLHVAAFWIGVVYAMNTGSVALFQIPVTRLLVRYRRTRSCALGQLVFGMAFLTYLTAAALPAGIAIPVGLVGGTILFSIAELMHSATTYALTASAAPEDLRGRHLAFYQFSWEIPRAAAPTVLTFLLAASPAAMWLLLAVGVIGSAPLLMRLEPRLPADAIYPMPAPGLAAAAGK
jgi:MFS family permease